MRFCNFTLGNFLIISLLSDVETKQSCQEKCFVLICLKTSLLYASRLDFKCFEMVQVLVEGVWASRIFEKTHFVSGLAVD